MTKACTLVLCFVLLGCGGGQKPAAKTIPAVSNTETVEPPPGFGDLEAAVAGRHRSEQNRARDRYRHPLETLGFFGVKPNQSVIELWPGRGWYTEILAPLLHDEGHLTAVVPSGRFAQPYRDFLASNPALYDRVEVVEVTPPNDLTLGPDGAADVVLTFRNIHNWISGGFAEQMHAAIFRALKPGGVYGVEEHRAKPGTTLEETKTTGYVTEEEVIRLATGAGLVLEERSEINANPNDTKDYPKGVWTLPPSLTLGDQDREKYLAIGESDRMTLRFRKPE